MMDEEHYFDVIAHLPTEINQIILSQLTAVELVNCCRVSKKWRELVSSDYLWKKLCYYDLGTRGTFVEVYPYDTTGTMKPPCAYQLIYNTVKKALLKWESVRPEVVVEVPRTTETVYVNSLMAAASDGQVDTYCLDDPRRHLQTVKPVLEASNSWDYNWVEGSHEELLILSAYKYKHLLYLCYKKNDDRFDCNCIIHPCNTQMRYLNPECVISDEGSIDYNPMKYPCGVIEDTLVASIIKNEELYLHFCSVFQKETIKVIKLTQCSIRRAWRVRDNGLYILDTTALTSYDEQGDEIHKLDIQMTSEERQPYDNTQYENPRLLIKHEVLINERVILAAFMAVTGQEPFCVPGDGIILIWNRETGDLLKTINCKLSQVSLHPSLPVFVYAEAPRCLVVADLDECSFRTLELTCFGLQSKYLHIGQFVAGKFIILNRRYQDLWGRDTIWYAMFDIENLVMDKLVLETSFKTVRKITKNVIEGYHKNSVGYSTFLVLYVI